MKERYFGLLLSINDPEEPLFSRLHPAPTGKCKKSASYDRNNKLLPKNAELPTYGLEKFKPKFSIQLMLSKNDISDLNQKDSSEEDQSDIIVFSKPQLHDGNDII